MADLFVVLLGELEGRVLVVVGRVSVVGESTEQPRACLSLISRENRLTSPKMSQTSDHFPSKYLL